MMAQPNGVNTCRIIVGLKAASDSDPPVNAATILASAIKAEVVGLFIEEDAMIDLAGLPFAHAINVGSTRAQRLTPQSMKQAISRGATTCERILSERARSARVKWSFSSERGNVSEKIRAAISSGDFLVVPSLFQGLGAHELLDELRSVPRQAYGVVIAAQQPERSGDGPVIAIDDGDTSGEKTISLAARIAAVTGVKLMLFALASTDAEADRITHRAHEIAGPGSTIDIHRFLPGTARSIAAGLMHFMPSFVVADLEGEPFGDDRAALSLLRAAKAPVVLVRTMEIGNDTAASSVPSD